MMQAPLLPYRRRPVRTLADDVAILLLALKGRGWVTRKQLIAPPWGGRNPYLLAVSGDETRRWTERHFRAVAEASAGRILGGNRGYCLTAEASVEDITHVENALRSQARKMIARSIQIRKARNA
jgi:hypothetical protein